MQHAKGICSVVAAVLVTWTVADRADAQQPQASTEVEVEVEPAKVSSVATVEKVDKRKRKLTVTDADGHQFKLRVPDDVANFNALKKGDTIDIDYYHSVALSLEEGRQPPSPAEAMLQISSPLPGGFAACKITETAEVVDICTTTNTMTIRLSTGELQTIAICPALQATLGELEVGDQVHTTYTEAVAIELTPR